jgi:hypothetical protein
VIVSRDQRNLKALSGILLLLAGSGVPQKGTYEPATTLFCLPGDHSKFQSEIPFVARREIVIRKRSSASMNKLQS